MHYIVMGGDCYPAKLRRLKNGSYRSIDSGMIYSRRNVRNWDQLTEAQKRRVIVNHFDDLRRAANYAVCKDDSLANVSCGWLAKIDADEITYLNALFSRK